MDDPLDLKRGGDALVVLQYYEQPAFPSLTIKKVSNGGTGSFAFKGATKANGFSTDNSYTINTTTAGTAVSGAPVALSANNVQTEVQETLPTGWAITSASCVDGNAANSGNPAPPTTFGTLVGNTLQIPATNVRAFADLQCTFTNAPATPTLTLSQLIITPFPVNLAPPFTFNYSINNGWPVQPQPLTTTAFNVPASTSARNLAAGNVDTTLSTSLPDSRWFVSSFACTDTKAAATGNPTGNLVRVVATSVTIPAANVRAGSALKCTLIMGHKVP